MNWPAFGDIAIADLELTFERGIWGKMHAVPTDYRWIGRSAGLPPAADNLELLLVVGPESAPAPASLWRSQEDFFIAAATYPSPSRDAAGRSGFLEKQVFVHRRRADVPAALAAFALLPMVRGHTSADWWDRRIDPNWHEKDFVLPIEVEPLKVSASEIEERIAAGLKDLAKISSEKLRKLYSGILSPAETRETNYLESITAPLSAEATAALLLPLPRERADRLSVAGWSLSTRYQRQRREVPWDILALDRISREEGDTGPASMRLSQEAQRAAKEIVEAILEAKPARLRKKEKEVDPAPATVSALLVACEPDPLITVSARTESALSEPELPPTERATAAEFDSSGSDVLENTTEPVLPVLPTEWKDLCDDIEGGLHFAELKQHEALLKSLPDVVSYWVKYACNGLPFLPPHALPLPVRWSVLAPEEPAISVLHAALRRVEQQSKSSSRADLLRAALLALDGSLRPKDVESLCVNNPPHVELLAFVGRLGKEAQEELKVRLADVWDKIPG